MLIEFYGEECPHCEKIAPLIINLEKELDIRVERKEVWHNEANMDEMRKYDTGMCGGVPFLINTSTSDFICGETDYEALRKWALGGTKEKIDHSPAQTNLDFNFIANGIYIGTNQCCKTHFDERLTNEGIEADISLEETRVDAPFGVDFYTWIPVKDRSAPTQEQLRFGVAVIDHMIRESKKIYIHCKNGHGRAPALVAAYLMRKGMSMEEALSLIKSKRPQVHLREPQIDALKKFKENMVLYYNKEIDIK